SGGAGGVEQGAEILGARGRLGPLRAAAREQLLVADRPLDALTEDDRPRRVRARNLAQALGPPGADDEGARAAGGRDRADRLGMQLVAEGDADEAADEDPVRDLDVGEAVGGDDRDPVAGLEAEGAETGGEAVRPFAQLGVGASQRVADQRRSRGEADVAVL